MNGDSGATSTQKHREAEEMDAAGLSTKRLEALTLPPGVIFHTRRRENGKDRHRQDRVCRPEVDAASAPPARPSSAPRT